MSERQAKRLRRAQRAYIRANKTSLAKGAPVHEAADARAAIVRQLWPRLNHRMRGAVAAYFTGRPLSHNAGDLNGALRALGIAVPS